MADGDRLPTNVRTLLILEALASSGRSLTPSDLGRAIGLPKPTIHRLCATLLDDGFLARDPAGKGLRPGRRAREMASGLIHNYADAAARRQILNQVAAAVHETVNFAAPTDDGMTYVDRVETDWAFRIQLPIGARVPFHRTASGKTFLASLKPSRRRKIIEALDFSDGPPNAHRSAASLEGELKEIARQGYALDNEELLEGMVALAVPVRDKAGVFVAALAFHGPNQRLSAEGMLEHLNTLRVASGRLTDILFGGDGD